MVILWSNLDGDKIEPSPTKVSNGSTGSKNRIKVALKPQLPSLFLPLIRNSSSGACSVSSTAPTTSINAVESPSSLASSCVTAHDSTDSSPVPDDAPQIVVIQSGFLSHDIGFVRYDPIPITSSTSRPQLCGKLPTHYGKNKNANRGTCFVCASSVLSSVSLRTNNNSLTMLIQKLDMRLVKWFYSSHDKKSSLYYCGPAK